jgi:hypothetical protein
LFLFYVFTSENEKNRALHLHNISAGNKMCKNMKRDCFIFVFLSFYSKDSSMDTAETRYNCEVGVVIDCPVNEECVQLVTHSRSGICHCMADYQRNSTGVCIPIG